MPALDPLTAYILEWGEVHVEAILFISEEGSFLSSDGLRLSLD